MLKVKSWVRHRRGPQRDDPRNVGRVIQEVEGAPGMPVEYEVEWVTYDGDRCRTLELEDDLLLTKAPPTTSNLSTARLVDTLYKLANRDRHELIDALYATEKHKRAFTKARSRANQILGVFAADEPFEDEGN